MDKRLEIIFSRRSIRRYTGEPVSEADVTSLLKAGMAAPSASNQKPWHFVVITDKRTGRSKGFGFVDMPRRSARRAIDALHGSTLEGRDLTVRFAEPRKYRS